MKLVGRKREVAIIQRILKSAEAEFLAIYGRRRVGKTFLINSLCCDDVDGRIFSLTGQKDGNLRQHLEDFSNTLSKLFYQGVELAHPKNWNDALEKLTVAIERDKQKTIIFLDELPWLATPRSGLVGAIDKYWNTRWSKIPYLKLIVCGSAASWMIENIVNHKGGLHNRVTRTILLAPFNLNEVEQYLASRKLKLDRQQVLNIFFATGGVPFYLRSVEPGLSAPQVINELCFREDGILHHEYKRLLSSLFRHSEQHDAILRSLAKKRMGLERGEIISDLGTSTGQGISKRLKELKEGGFIGAYSPLGNSKKSVRYRIIDEYVLFYLTWIDSLSATFIPQDENFWQRKVNTPQYNTWAGLTFENVCLKHTREIARALRLAAIGYKAASWHRRGTKNKAGAQIDLLFDRDDEIITLCEMKFSSEPYVLTRDVGMNILKKVDVFKEATKCRKQVMIALASPHGLSSNVWSEEIVDNVITLDDLFCSPG